MKQEVINAFHTQISLERDAAVVYEAMSIWCAVHEYPGFAEFFKKHAGEELTHASKFIDHMTARGKLPTLAALEAPPAEYDDLLAVAKAALAHEEANTQGVNVTLEAATAARDYPAINLLNWFVNEQVEEEVWANRMVTLVKRATCAGSMYALDRHIVADLAGAVA